MRMGECGIERMPGGEHIEHFRAACLHSAHDQVEAEKRGAGPGP
jgi:hypothetical protein